MIVLLACLTHVSYHYEFRMVDIILTLVGLFLTESNTSKLRTDIALVYALYDD